MFGGLWCCCGKTTTCGSCSPPQKNLTVSWVNATLGNGSTTLTLTGPNTWLTSCAGPGGIYTFSLSCVSNVLTFKVTKTTSGSCPSGPTVFCSNASGPPAELNQQACCPGSGLAFSLDYAVGNCAVLFGDGFTQFSVSDGPPAHYVCCGGEAFPPTIYVTDSYTTFPCNYSSGVWIGCYTMPVSSAIGPCGCVALDAPAAGSCSVIYRITCGGDPGKLNITRSWYTCGRSATYCSYCADTLDSDCNIVTQTCDGVPGNDCSTAGTDSVSGAIPTSYAPLPGRAGGGDPAARSGGHSPSGSHRDRPRLPSCPRKQPAVGATPGRAAPGARGSLVLPRSLAPDRWRDRADEGRRDACGVAP
jgi:hypothetical protein